VPPAPASPPPRAAAPAPAPTAAPPAAAPAPQAPSQVAALPPADGRVGRIDFGSGAAELPATARETLDKAVAALRQDEGSRVQIVAYATGGDDSGSQARRLSLSRALAVRSYLIEQGVRSTRMDVRALGNRSSEGPADRVDIVLVRR
jgi:outer membrane protein OmpA-like peptidoglycan-associated protein